METQTERMVTMVRHSWCANCTYIVVLSTTTFIKYTLNCNAHGRRVSERDRDHKILLCSRFIHCSSDSLIAASMLVLLVLLVCNAYHIKSIYITLYIRVYSIVFGWFWFSFILTRKKNKFFLSSFDFCALISFNRLLVSVRAIGSHIRWKNERKVKKNQLNLYWKTRCCCAYPKWIFVWVFLVFQHFRYTRSNMKGNWKWSAWWRCAVVPLCYRYM